MNIFKHSVIAALLLASPLVGAETDYPASDFQPKVLYKDAEYKSTAAAPAESATSSKAASASSSADDAQYPATDFKPKVVYKDDNYKPSTNAASPASSSSKSSTSAASSAGSSSRPTTNYEAEASAASIAVANNAESGSKPNYLIILAVLGIVGFVFYKNKPKKCASKSSAAPRPSYSNTGLTGVAKYVNRVSGTGVARYLEKQIKSAPAAPATGVAKYVAKQVITAKTTVKEAAATTGVEKYVRNRR